jgi:hypothetical protein
VFCLNFLCTDDSDDGHVYFSSELLSLAESCFLFELIIHFMPTKRMY